MTQSKSSDNLVIRILFAVSLISVFVWGIQDSFTIVEGTQNWAGKFTLTWGLPLAVLLSLGVFVFLWSLLNIWGLTWAHPINKKLARLRDRLKWLRWLFAAGIVLFPAKIILYTPLGFLLVGTGIRLALLMVTATVVAVLVTNEREQLLNWQSVLVSLLITGSVFAVAQEFTVVLDHPFSLTWSEGNRIWDYSVLYGQDLYNYPLDQRLHAYIDRGRQSLWGLPFLLPNISILHVRLWSALVYTVPYALLGWMIFRPLPDHHRQWIWLGLWTFLFLQQGPIYTPLVLSAILVAGARGKPLWLALPLIYLAGYYAQLSRLTWMVAPAMWAVMIVLVDIVKKDERLTWPDWLKIIVLPFAGLLGGVGISRGWNRVSSYLSKVSENTASALATAPAVPTLSESGEILEVINQGGSSFVTDQPLLWARFWPNATYELGIIFSLILAVGPLLILLVYLIRSKRWRLNTWQQTAIFAILLAFLVVGIIASVKIGGGGDLHNLDMLLIGLLFTAALAWEHGGHALIARIDLQPVWVKMSIFFAVAIPVFSPMIGAHPIELPPEEKTQWTMELLQAEVGRVLSSGGEVLFMDQRQLLTFGYLQDVPLVPEYEKKLVMDKAMSGDSEYFVPFYQDLAEQRFSLIITDPQRVRYADEGEGWSEENDTWVRWVTEPLLCYYETKYSIKKTGVWFLVPSEDISACSIPLIGK